MNSNRLVHMRALPNVPAMAMSLPAGWQLSDATAKNVLRPVMKKRRELVPLDQAAVASQ